MAPKKKATQTMSLGDFLSDQSLGPSSSWADEVEEYTSIGTQPLPPSDRPSRQMGGWGSGGGDRGDRGYATRDRDFGPQRIPDRPPYTAHLGNLSYDATVETVTDFFTGCDIISVRIIEDRELQKPKGFAYAEFQTADGLKKALTLDATPFEGRPMRIKVADPPRGGDRERTDSSRDLSVWERKGPLPDIQRSRGPADFGERRPSRDPAATATTPDDGKVRDFNNWERRGPLSPRDAPPMERQMSREGSRSRNEHLPRTDSFRNRKAPATWGEGRPPTEEGARGPPRRDFSDRPDRPDRPERAERAERPERPERTATAAEKDMQWRDRMRPDPPAKSPEQSRPGSEAPPSPAISTSTPAVQSPGPVSGASATRPRLNLQKRTVSEAVETPSAAGGDSKASPFGAARPIDTAARERAVEEKRQQAVKEKREAEEKAKEDRRIAKEAAAKTEAESGAAAAAGEVKEPEAPKAEETTVAPETPAETPAEAPAENTEAAEKSEITDKPAAEGEAQGSNQKHPHRPKDGPPKFPPSRAAENNNWRATQSDRPRGAPSGPRGRGGSGTGRGGGRGSYDSNRGPRSNGSSGQQQQQQQRDDQPPSTPTTSQHVDDDGWTTVTPTNKRRSQGRNQMMT
jgi:translation initiation factor 4B